MTLFERCRQEPVILDYGVFGPIDTADPALLEALLSLPPRGYPIATRAAALALAAEGAPFQCAPAGGCASLAGDIDLFSLWRATPPDLPATAVR